MPDSEFLLSTMINLSINLVYTIFVLIISVIALKYIDSRMLKVIELEHEIKKGNIAAAIFASSFLLFIAIIVGSSIG